MIELAESLGFSIWGACCFKSRITAIAGAVLERWRGGWWGGKEVISSCSGTGSVVVLRRWGSCEGERNGVLSIAETRDWSLESSEGRLLYNGVFLRDNYCTVVVCSLSQSSLFLLG